MAEERWTTALLLAAVVLNVGWLWVPLGLISLVVVSWGTHRMVKDRWPRWLEAAVLVVAWLPFVYVVLSAGLTIGAGGRQLLSIGGSQDPDLIRAASGVVIPLLVAGQLWAWRRGLVRKLAAVSVVLWVVAAPLTLFVGERLGPDIDEIEDPEDVEAPGTAIELLVVAPFIVTYGLAVAAAGMATWEDRAWATEGDPRDRDARRGHG